MPHSSTESAVGNGAAGPTVGSVGSPCQYRIVAPALSLAACRRDCT